MPAIVDEGFDMPLAKRQKVNSAPASTAQNAGSRIFTPYRTLGLVSPTSVPFTSVRLGKGTFQITTSVGKSLHTYDLRRGLNLVFLSRPQTPEPITATYAWKDVVFAAWGGFRPGIPAGIWVFKRGKRVAELQPPPTVSGPIVRLLVFGSWIVACSERSIEVWKNQSYEHYTTLLPANSTDQPVFSGQMCTMPTYLNKVFVGRYDGSVDIWNVSTGKRVYTILPTNAKDGAVTALEPTPALSLIAIAYRSGTLVIHNVDQDKTIITLNASPSRSGPVTSIAFRTDGLGAGEDGNEAGAMATATIHSGDITIWDLNNGGRKAGVLRSAHEMARDESDGGVNKIEFLEGQPVLVSSGKDNALRTWIFDAVPFSPIPRPLHSRSGHAGAITALEFLPTASDGSDSMGKWLLSGSKDHSLWGFSLRRDGQNQELSQGNIKSTSNKKLNRTGDRTRIEDLKAPEITAIACSLNRDPGMGTSVNHAIWANTRDFEKEARGPNGWESIVTAHRGDKFARTWYWGRKKAGRWAFETSDGTEVKSVAISPCGTFAVIGSAGGAIDMFNLQSGLHRQRFPPPPVNTGKGAKGKPKTSLAASDKVQASKHTKAVTGLAVDNLNRTVISCSLDGKVKFWDLLSGQLLSELDWAPMTAITGLRYSSASELVAFSCDDLSIRVVDVETKKIVREFWGCRGQINDFVFSADGRWMIAASMDSIIRVWDLPTGHLIDAFRVPSTCTALAFSSTGEFLATAHADGVGINIWNNKTLFVDLPPKHIDENEISDIRVPTESTELNTGLVEAAFTENTEEGEPEQVMPSIEQLHRDMMTLSVVPKSTWQTLIHLDTIRERNKPKEPPKAPEKAPFFLPSLSENNKQPNGIALQENKNEPSTEVTAAERSRIAKLQQSGDLTLRTSHVSDLLKKGNETGNYNPFIDYLKSLSPGKADLEIRSLDPQTRDGRCELVDFVNALTERLRSKRDYELINAWMAVFLRVHGDVIGNLRESATPEDSGALSQLQDALRAWKAEQQRETQRLGQLTGYCRGVVGFLRSAR